jgi:hypothetical protein
VGECTNTALRTRWRGLHSRSGMCMSRNGRWSRPGARQAPRSNGLLGNNAGQAPSAAAQCIIKTGDGGRPPARNMTRPPRARRCGRCTECLVAGARARYAWPCQLIASSGGAGGGPRHRHTEMLASKLHGGAGSQHGPARLLGAKCWCTCHNVKPRCQQQYVGQ